MGGVCAPERRALRTGEFYLPRLGRHVLPQDVPITLMRFVSRYRTLFDGGSAPKPLDLEAQFGGLADNLHLLVNDPSTGVWRFERFAPAYAKLLGLDLTGTAIFDPRHALYGARLDDKLNQLVQRESPFYAMTHIGGADRAEVMHRLLIPLSNTGHGVTHALVFAI